MATPLVSVLTTAYNREKYIAEAVESVLASTFQDFELIVVDDASSDRTVEIARRFEADHRVRVVRNEKNLGDYPNRNRAAEFARGKYLKYLDSDDVIYPHGLECMVRAMEQFPEAALGICRPTSPSGPYPQQVWPEQAYKEHFLLSGLFAAGPSGCIILSSAFRDLKGFSGKRFVGDTEMWLRLAARHPIIKMPGDLIWWRVHAGQEYFTGEATLAHSYMNYKIATEAISALSCPLSKLDREKAIRRLKHIHARGIWRLAVRGGCLRSALLLYQDSGLSLMELAKGLVRANRRF